MIALSLIPLLALAQVNDLDFPAPHDATTSESPRPEEVRIHQPSATLFPDAGGLVFMGVHFAHGAWAGITIARELGQPVLPALGLGMAIGLAMGLVGYCVQRAFPVSLAAAIASLFVGFGTFVLGAASTQETLRMPGAIGRASLGVGGLFGCTLGLLGWAAIPDSPTLGLARAIAPFAAALGSFLLVWTVMEWSAPNARHHQPGAAILTATPVLGFVATRMAIAFFAEPEDSRVTVVVSRDAAGGAVVGAGLAAGF